MPDVNMCPRPSPYPAEAISTAAGWPGWRSMHHVAPSVAWWLGSHCPWHGSLDKRRLWLCGLDESCDIHVAPPLASPRLDKRCLWHGGLDAIFPIARWPERCSFVHVAAFPGESRSVYGPLGLSMPKASFPPFPVLSITLLPPPACTVVTLPRLGETPSCVPIKTGAALALALALIPLSILVLVLVTENKEN